MIVALTRDGGLASVSPVNRFLRHPILQWLGKISMAIYVIHW